MKIDANSSGTIGFDDFTNYLLLQQVDSPLKLNCSNSILNSAIIIHRVLPRLLDASAMAVQ
jgi:hypothetical protein